MGLEGRQLPQLNLNGFDMEELDLAEATSWPVASLQANGYVLLRLVFARVWD